MPETKREYLVRLGLAKPGRGRMSAAAHQAITDAVNNGIKFAEPDREVRTVTVKDKEGRTVSRRVDAVADVPDPRPDRPNGIYVFENPDGTKFKRSHAAACAACSYSLAWCYCPQGPTQFPYPLTGDWNDRAKLVQSPAKAVITTKDVPEKQPQQGMPGTRRGTRRGGRRGR